jgi:hypothetical protein
MNVRETEICVCALGSVTVCMIVVRQMKSNGCTIDPQVPPENYVVHTTSSHNLNQSRSSWTLPYIELKTSDATDNKLDPLRSVLFQDGLVIVTKHSDRFVLLTDRKL